MLETLVTRPIQAERVPLVLVNPGNPRDADARGQLSPTPFAGLSMAFARHGYGVAVVMRQGFGRSSGRSVDTSGRCDDKEYLRSAHAPAEEILSALERLRREAWVDPARVMFLGHSAGGLQSLAAAAVNPPGVIGVISFAGGRGSDGPDHVCQPDRLVTAFREIGRTSAIPSLWIYAQNDHFFSPALGVQMRDAYASGGARAALVIAPSFSDDGHRLVFAEPEIWWPPVAAFLKERGLPTDLAHPPAPVALHPPPDLGEAGRAAFAQYASSEAFEKAFATYASHWAWVSGKRSGAEAARSALERCASHGKHCSLYAVGNEYAR